MSDPEETSAGTIPRVEPGLLSMFDDWVVWLSMKEYGWSEDDAIRRFLGSKTHAMLEDELMKLWHESPLMIFDLFQNEIANGDPRFSTYLMGDSLYVRA